MMLNQVSQCGKIYFVFNVGGDGYAHKNSGLTARKENT